MTAITRLALVALAFGANASSHQKCAYIASHPSAINGSSSVATRAFASDAAVSAKAAVGFSSFKPGVKWEICIHKPIKHDSAADFIPTEAIVFDIDLSHAEKYSSMIPKLKVSIWA